MIHECGSITRILMLRNSVTLKTKEYIIPNGIYDSSSWRDERLEEVKK